VHILITGGCGFVGSRLALHFAEQSHRVVVMDNLVRRGGEGNIERLRKRGIEFLHGDVRNAEDFANLPPGIEVICDASAHPSVVTGYANPIYDISNNALGVIRVLEYARQHCCPLIFWSSNRVYNADLMNDLPRCDSESRLLWDAEAWGKLPHGLRPRGFDPVHGISEEFSVDGGQHSIYGLSKLMADLACQEYARAYDMPVVVNRFGVISGGGQFGKTEQGWLAWWAIAHWFGLPLTYIGWKGKQVRDILFIDDVCFLADLEMKQIGRFRGEVFNAGGGAANSLSLLEATKEMQKRIGRTTAIVEEAAPRKADIPVYFTDNRKVEKTLGWKPQTGLDRGLQEILRWIRENEAELRALYGSSA
jgi:CDP-paratose 2-epimerase